MVVSTLGVCFVADLDLAFGYACRLYFLSHLPLLDAMTSSGQPKPNAGFRTGAWYCTAIRVARVDGSRLLHNDNI